MSFAYTFDKANADAPSRHKTQYFEMMGDHAIYHEGWIASHESHPAALGRCRPGEPGSAAQRDVGALRPEQRLDAVE